MKLVLPVFAMIMAVSLSGPAFGENLSQEGYDEAKRMAEANFDTAKKNCDTLAGSAKDICRAEAQGNFDIAKANAEAEFKGTDKARFEAEKVKVDSEYKVAKERCAEMAGDSKSICQKEAKAKMTKGIENAKLMFKKKELTSERREDMKAMTDDANEAKMRAEYDVAIEKCNTYSGQAKTQCIDRAKERYQG